MALSCVLSIGLAGCSVLPERDPSACGQGQPAISTDREAPKANPDGPVSTDADELRRIFPSLPDPERVIWARGHLGDDRMPGLPAYYLEAVMVVSPQVAGQLGDGGPPAAPLRLLDPRLAGCEPTGSPTQLPDLDTRLQAEAPPESGTSLVWYAVDRTLVLSSTGERVYAPQ